MRSVDSEVLMVSGTVPVPVAGAPDVLAEEPLDSDDDALDEEDDEVSDVPPDFSTFSIAADNWVLVRFSAVWLAMLAKPLPKLVSAELMALITELVAAVELSFSWALLQQSWSCCQNDGVLPMLPMAMNQRLSVTSSLSAF